MLILYYNIDIRYSLFVSVFAYWIESQTKIVRKSVKLEWRNQSN